MELEKLVFFTIMCVTCIILAIIWRTGLNSQKKNDEFIFSTPSDTHTYAAARLCLAPHCVAFYYVDALKWIEKHKNKLLEVSNISNRITEGTIITVGINKDDYLLWLKEYTSNPNWIIIQETDERTVFGIQKLEKDS